MTDKITCPKCKSTNISQILEGNAIMLGQNEYKCNKCGYEGIMFIQETKKKKK
jgi:transposase-like protein